MRIILALRGPGHTGKSITLRFLRQLLINNNFRLEWTSDLYRGRVDFISIFEKSGYKIGIASSCKSYNDVRYYLRKLVDENCSICICSCRSVGGTNKAIIEFSAYHHDFIEKTIDRNITQEATNISDAKLLLQRINFLL